MEIVDLGPAAQRLADLVEHVGGLALAFTAAANKERSKYTEEPAPGNADRLGDDWRTRIPRDLANLAVDRLLHRMDTKANGNDGVREYRVGARVVKRDSCRQFDPSRASKSAKPRSPAKA